MQDAIAYRVTSWLVRVHVHYEQGPNAWLFLLVAFVEIISGREDYKR